MTTLDMAEQEFREFPNNETAGAFLIELMVYEEDNMIGDDTFRDGLAAIAVYLAPNFIQEGASCQWWRA